jgi:hypothetical protein
MKVSLGWIFALTIIPPSLLGFSSQLKNDTNCLGTIILHNGEKIDVAQIQIGKRSPWSVYSVPAEGKAVALTGGKTEVLLDNDPRDSEVLFAITQIKTMQVPNPHKIFIYKEGDKGMPYKYLEVIVNGDRYLAPRDTNVDATQTSNNASRRVKLHGLKEFAIRECAVLEVPEKTEK